jgi:predicted RNase H-like nuclease (RuvC/YqgF family)
MFSYQESAIQTQDLAANTVDPANMWSDSYALPSAASGYDDIHRSPSNAKTEKSDDRDKPFDILQPLTIESGPTRRARHAVTQQHGQARDLDRISYRNSSANEADTQATEKKQRLRQANKVAAAKCRVRQKKQTQTIQAKYERLSETNAQLKTCVQGLRRELNSLRACALGHAGCDCPIARYNQDRAKRVAAQYYSFCSGHGEMAITASPREPIRSHQEWLASSLR